MSGNWLDSSFTSNRYIQTYVKGFVDISGGNLLLRPGNNHIIVQGGDISLNGRLIIGNSTSIIFGNGAVFSSGGSISGGVVSSDLSFAGNLFVNGNVLPVAGATLISGNLFTGNTVSSTPAGYIFMPGTATTPASLAATTAGWTNTSITWTATASSNAAGYNPFMAFTANVSANVAVAGNLVGNGWLSATAGYNATTGLYTGNAYTTAVSTIGTVSGEWIQIGGNTATSLSAFQLAATNDSTGAHNDRLPTAFTIVASNVSTPGVTGVAASFWGTANPPTVGTMWVATSSGTVYYSYNGINWTSTPGPGGAFDVFYTGSLWLTACQSQIPNIYYSYNGFSWSSVPGPAVTAGDSQGFGTNGSMIICGFWANGSSSLVYSYNGLYWTALGNSALTTWAGQSAYSGTMWIAIGSGTNSIAYSYNGTQWTGITGTTIFATYGWGVAISGSMWVATGQGGNTIAYSYNGTQWTGLGTSIFSTNGGGIATSGSMWVATGVGTNTIAYSYTGTVWTGLGASITTSRHVAYSGSMWVLGGTQAYSYNGINWTVSGPGMSTIASNVPLYGTYGTLSTPILTGSFTSNPYLTNAVTGNGAATPIYTIPTSIVTNATQGALTYSTYGNQANKYLYYRMIVTKIAGNTYGVPSASVSGNVGGFWLPTFQNAGQYFTNLSFSTYTPASSTVSANIMNNTLLFQSNTPVYSNITTTTTLVGNTYLGTTTITVGNIVPNSSLALASSSWVNNSITWTATASSFVPTYPPNAAFNSTVAGSGWLSGSASYNNDTTGAYTGNVITTLSTGNTITGEWLQIQGSSSQTISSFQLAAANDTTTTGSFPQTISIVGITPSYNGLAASFWGTTNPPPAGTMWVAGGASMYYSYNGINWSVSPSAISIGTAFDVAYSGTMWVVANNTAPYLFYSYTGITWTGVPNSSVTAANNWGIATSGSIWVCASSGTNTISYSYNGLNWTGLGNTVITSQGFQPAYSGTLWVIGGSGNNSIAYSYNGTQWTGITGTTIFGNYGFGVATNGTVWVMVGQGTNTIAYSYNGTQWTGLGTAIFGSNGYGVATNGTMFVATGVTTNTLAYSYTGTVWTGLGTAVGTHQYGERIAYNGSMWVVTSNSGTYLAYSYNGTQWTVSGTTGVAGAVQAVASNVPLFLTTISAPILTGTFNYNPFLPTASTTTVSYPPLTSAYAVTSSLWGTAYPPAAGTMWVASGGTSMYYSYNGINWSVSPSAISGTPYEVAYSGTMWVVANSSSTNFYYSYNGITWTGVPNPPSSNNNWGIATSGSVWVCTANANGGNTIYYSYNGLNWTGLGTTVSTNQSYQPAYSGTMWIVGGSVNNLIAYSYNGIQWTGITGTSIFSTLGFGVATNGTVWVMVGQGTNSIAYSYNGTQWTGLGTAIFSANGYGVATSGTMWVATGTGTNTLAYSYTGTVWTGLGTAVSTHQWGEYIAYSGSMWVSASNGGTYLAYSYNGINWSYSGVTGIAGATYAVASNVPLFSSYTVYNTNTPIYTTNTFVTNPLVSAGGVATSTTVYTIPSGTVTNATQGALTYSTYGNSLNSYLSYRLIVSNVSAQKFGAASSIVNSRAGAYWFPGFGSTTTGTIANYQVNTFSSIQSNIASYTKSQVALTLDPVVPNQLDLSGGSFSISSGNIVVSSSTLGNIYTGTSQQSNIALGTIWVATNIATPASLAATTASWTNTSITWAATASSSSPGYSPNMAFTANIAGNVAVAGNLVGNGWLSATAGYNATTGLYTGNVYTTTVSTIGNVAGEWIQIGGNTATSLSAFQLVATNDSTGAHNDRLPTAVTIVASNSPSYITGLAASLWGTGNAPAAGTMWVAGSSSGIIYYSYNGTTWSASPTAIAGISYDVAYSGTIWVVSTTSSPYLFYSYNGITWTGVPNSPLTNIAYGVATSGSVWVSVGPGSNTIAYSYNGVNWTGLGTSIWSSQAFQPAYSGTMWIIGGEYTNYIAYSYNGIQWTGITGSTIFSIGGFGVATNGTVWVMVGQGTNTIAYSYNGTQWTGLGTAIFGNNGWGIATNGTMWVATGTGTNTLAYSYTGTVWTGLGTAVGTHTYGERIAYSGSMWITTSNAGTYLAYSYNGTQWTVSGTTGVAGATWSVASNAPLYGNNTYTLPTTYYPILTGSFTSNPYLTNAITGNGAATPIYTIPTYQVTNAIQGALTYTTYGNTLNKYLYYRMIVTQIAGNTYGVPSASVSGNVGGFWLPTFQNYATGYNVINQTNYSQLTRGQQVNPTGSLLFTGTIPTYSTTISANVYTGNTFVANTTIGNVILSNYNVNYNPTVTSTAITGYTNSSVSLLIDSVAPNQLDISGSLAIVGGTTSVSTYTFGNVNAGSATVSIPLGNVYVAGCVMTPASLAATTASWTNTSITWTANASSNAAGYNPFMAFTANIAGNVAVAGNLVGNGWLSATAGYNATTGLYTGTTYLTLVSTIGTVSGEWIQINGNAATSLSGFQLAATNDSTGAHNDRLPTAFTIAGSNYPIGTSLPLTYVVGTYGSATPSSLSTSMIIYSYDTVRWSTASYPTTIQFNNVYALATNGFIWLATGNASSLIYSYNGISWSNVSATSGISNYPINLAFGNGIWLLSQNSATAGATNLLYSYNGLTWTGISTLSSIVQCTYYNSKMWVGVGGNNAIHYSYDGFNWTAAIQRAASSNLIGTGVAVTYSGSMWVALGAWRSTTPNGLGSLAYSYDGIIWSASANGTIFGDGGGTGGGGVLGTNGTMWIAGGFSCQYAGAYNLAYSYNGIQWSQNPNVTYGWLGSDSGYRIHGILWSGTLWLVSYNSFGKTPNSVVYSYDGIAWTGVSQTTSGQPTFVVCNSNYLMIPSTPILTGSFTSNPYLTDAVTGNGAATPIYTIPTSIVTNATQGALTYSTYGNQTVPYLYYRMIVTKIAGNTYGVPSASVSGNVGGFWLPTFQNALPAYTNVNQTLYTPTVVNTTSNTTPYGITLSAKVPIYATSTTGNQLVSNVYAGTVTTANTVTNNYSLTYSPLVIANSITGYTTNSVNLTLDGAATNQLNLSGNLNVTGTVYPTSMSETFTTIATSTSPFTLNFGNGATFYLTSPPSSNFTCNITNVPSTIGRTYLCTLIITASTYKTFCNSVQINGNTAITPYFANGIPSSISNGSFVTQTIAIQRISKGDVAGSVNVLSTVTPWY